MWIRLRRAGVAERTSRPSARAPRRDDPGVLCDKQSEPPMDDELLDLLSAEPELLRLCLLARAVTDRPDPARRRSCPAARRRRAARVRRRRPCPRPPPRRAGA